MFAKWEEEFRLNDKMTKLRHPVLQQVQVKEPIDSSMWVMQKDQQNMKPVGKHEVQQ